MKKFLIALFTIVLSISGYADETPGVMLFEINGQVFYVKDKKLLEKLIKSNSCIGNSVDGDILKLYDILYSACKDGMVDMIQQANLGHYYETSMIGNNALRNFGARLASSQRIPINDAERVDIIANALERCIITKEMLINALTKTQNTTDMQITADIDKCISQIAIDEHVDQDSCPLGVTVPETKYIESILHLNSAYRFKTFSFPVTGKMNQDKVLVFNGNVLVACERDKPVYLVRPTYSGRESCQNNQYQNILGMGGTPNGIYIVQSDSEPKPLEEDKWASWGKYRIPLVPSTDTNTYGRTNMYLHGTNDSNKHRSGGCISLGIAIDKFIETGFITGTVPVIVNTETVYQDWMN